MRLDLVPLRPLERGQLTVMRLRAVVPALVLLGAGIAVEAALADRGYIVGVAIGIAVLLAAWTVFVSPAKRWQHWGYAFTGEELHVARGWWTQVHTVVPVSRVQHIDVRQSLVERRCGVATLALHTAGTEHARVTLPGIAREEAESIRDAIRARIGDSAS